MSIWMYRNGKLLTGIELISSSKLLLASARSQPFASKHIIVHWKLSPVSACSWSMATRCESAFKF
jgi:hypothetical protein